ncbi:MAG: Flp pilus assembly complex ATPase component TadA [Kiritimatiellae bacterium]|nr:Flp pilus assembly complex ATPase component TadA [Kiritimatiellia bacterium]
MAAQPFGGRIAEILMKNGSVDTEALQEAAEKVKADGGRLEKYLVESGLVSSVDMTLALSEYLGMPPIELARFAPDERLVDLIPRDVLKKHLAVPIARTADMLTVALGDPFDIVALDEMHSLSGLSIIPVIAPEKEVTELLARVASGADGGLEDILKDVADGDVELSIEESDDVSLDEMLEKAEGAPVIRIVNGLLVEAIKKHASDIHIEPMEKSIRLRYRIDGVLYENPSPPKNLQAAIISRIKIMSNLDIAERRVPQDGRFKIHALSKEIDIRVSILPTVHGEKIVMRTLDKSNLAKNLGSLGLDQQAFESFTYAIQQPYGMLLVTGPTGSGKTTTLYSCLQEINQPDVNIITVEDPVEYQLGGVNQVQTNADVGLTFSSALRSILRQDPDVVMVGEIRDQETADIAVKAALTGHLVLSTLHTNDAAGAIARLLDMGIESFLLASSIIMTQAQRLYRKVCPACRKARDIPLDVLSLNKIDPEFFEDAQFYEARGCIKCVNTGYKGRGALMEVLLVDPGIRELMLRDANAGALRDQAVQNGMLTLRQLGLMKVKEGTTTIEEALRVTGGGAG